MNRTQETIVIAAAGIATSIATAFLNLLIMQWTGFNLFSFSYWVILPIGAIICGFLAASGYFLAAKQLHVRPTSALLVQMIVVAALTQVLIYWLEYRWATVDGVAVSDFIGFRQYLSVILETQQITTNRLLLRSGEVGTFGYVLAGLDLAGFLLGGLGAYLWLKGLPACEPCQKYLRTVVTKKDVFADREDFFAYFNEEFVHPIDSPEFAAFVGKANKPAKGDKPFITVTAGVEECPSCKTQAVRETVQIYENGNWTEVSEWSRVVPIPHGIDVRSAYAGGR